MSDFKAKMHQIRFPPGLLPRSRWGSLQRSPDSLAVFRRPTSKEREEEEGKGEKGKAREGKGRRRRTLAVANSWLRHCVEVTGKRV